MEYKVSDETARLLDYAGDLKSLRRKLADFFDSNNCIEESKCVNDCFDELEGVIRSVICVRITDFAHTGKI